MPATVPPPPSEPTPESEENPITTSAARFTSRLWHPDYPFAPRRRRHFYGWTILWVATLGILFSIPGQTMGFSVFTDRLMAELGLSRVQISLAYCIGTVASGFLLPWMGTLFDRFGARRMICFAALATGLILFYLASTRLLLDRLASLLPGLPRFGLAFAIITLGFFLVRASAQGVLTMACRNAMGKWFEKRRGLVLGISGAIGAFGFSLAPWALNQLIRQFGWQGAWVVLGVLCIVGMALLGWLLIRDNPEECGLEMDGGWTPHARAGHEPHVDTVVRRDYTRHEALATFSFWTFNLSFAFFALFSTAFTFHILSIGEDNGWGPQAITGSFIPMAVISVLTNLLCGWLSSRARIKWSFAAMNLAALAGVIGTIFLDTRPGLIAFIAGNGICGGFFTALVGLSIPRFFGREHLGAISGVVMSSMVVASGLGPIVFSLSRSIAGSYVPVLWLSALIPLGLAVASGWAENPQRGE